MPIANETLPVFVLMCGKIKEEREVFVMTAKDLYEWAKENGVEEYDLRTSGFELCDMPSANHI